MATITIIDSSIDLSLTDEERYIIERVGVEVIAQSLTAMIEGQARRFHEADAASIKEAFDQATPELKTEILTKLRVNLP